jgi:hypothetical protein
MFQPASRPSSLSERPRTSTRGPVEITGRRTANTTNGTSTIMRVAMNLAGTPAATATRARSMAYPANAR